MAVLVCYGLCRCPGLAVPRADACGDAHVHRTVPAPAGVPPGTRPSPKGSNNETRVTTALGSGARRPGSPVVTVLGTCIEDLAFQLRCGPTAPSLEVPVP